MSSNAAATNDTSATDPAVIDAPAAEAKGKGKGKNVPKDDHMEEDEDDDEEDEEDVEEDEVEDEEEDEDLHEIDPSAILAPGSRRSTRGNRVDYTSAEALAKAGLKPETADEDDEDDEMKDD